MRKIVVLNSENIETSVSVVRYFKYKNDYFLIFTYDEVDENGKQKLYIVQILDELGEKVARNITDIDEWNDIQVMIKDSIKQIKKGNDNNVEMLNVYELNNVKIDSPREFKVDPKLVNLLNMDIIDDVSDSDIDLANMLEEINERGQVSNMIENVEKNAEASVGMNDANNNENKENKENELNKCNEDNTINKEDIDFEKMYYALKEDNEATEAMLDDLMTKLLLYKEKYGELPQE